MLKDNSFRLILNSNPISREMVFRDKRFCLRSSPHKVDINRNWNKFFGKKIILKEEYCGVHAFSEIETVFIKETLEDYMPDVFLTIHSGSMALFHPYAYKKYTNYKDTLIGKEINIILNEIKPMCKKCMIGSPSELIGYLSSGSSLDYVYENLKVPITMAWEIFELENFEELNEYNLKKNNKYISKLANKLSRFRFKETKSFIRDKNIKNNKDGALLKQDSNGIYLKMKKLIGNLGRFDKSYDILEGPTDIDDDSETCFKLFNPYTKSDFDYTIEFWMKILSKFIKDIHSPLIKYKTKKRRVLK